MNNLINDPDYTGIVGELRNRLYEKLENRDGEHMVPYTKKFSSGAVYRHVDRSEAAQYPEEWLRQGDEQDLQDFFVPDAVRAEQEASGKQ